MSSSWAATGDITIIAGTGTKGYSGDGGPATLANIQATYGGIAVDRRGNVYLADAISHTIRRVDAATGIITRVAGQPNVHTPFSNKTGGDGILATESTFTTPSGITVDAYGNLYVGEQSGARLRRIDAWTGIINTVAGTGIFGSDWDTFDGQLAKQVNLSMVTGVAVGKNGDLFTADLTYYSLWKIDATTKTINLVFPVDQRPEGVDSAYGVKADSIGNIYFSSGAGIQKLTISTGQVELLVPIASMHDGWRFTIDGANNLYFSTSANIVSKWDSVTRSISPVAIFPVSVTEKASDGAGNLYVTSEARIYKVEGVTTPAPNADGGICIP